MFSSLYEITESSHIAKQAFAKTPNSIVLTHEATREKLRWAAGGGGKKYPHRTEPVKDG
jgi:hypothetical protein